MIGFHGINGVTCTLHIHSHACFHSICSCGVCPWTGDFLKSGVSRNSWSGKWSRCCMRTLNDQTLPASYLVMRLNDDSAWRRTSFTFMYEQRDSACCDCPVNTRLKTVFMEEMGTKCRWWFCSSAWIDLLHLLLDVVQQGKVTVVIARLLIWSQAPPGTLLTSLWAMHWTPPSSRWAGWHRAWKLLHGYGQDASCYAQTQQEAAFIGWTYLSIFYHITLCLT